MTSNQRTQRQEQIKGWYQDALEDANVGIIGSGQIAQAVAAYCAGLGVGTLTLVDNATKTHGFLAGRHAHRPSPYTVECMEERLTSLNSDLTINPYTRTPLAPRLEKNALSLCDVIVNTEAIRGWVSRGFETATQSERTLLYISLNPNPFGNAFNACLVGRPGEHGEKRLPPGTLSCSALRDSTTQSSLDAVIMGAMAAERIRGALMPMQRLGECGELPAEWSSLSAHEKQGYLTCRTYSDGLFQDDPKKEQVGFTPEEFPFDSGGNMVCLPSEHAPRSKEALVIGGGGIGTQACMALSSHTVHNASPRRIDIADPDHVSYSNLHRMTWFTEEDAREGKNKAQALAREIEQQDTGIEVNAYARDITASDNALLDHPYDYIFLCLDDAKAKRDICRTLVANGHPATVMYGTVGPFDGVLGAYRKGYSHCPNCQNDFFEAAIEHQQKRATSCSDVGQNNIVVMNALVGGHMVGRAYNTGLAPESDPMRKLSLTSRAKGFGRIETAYEPSQSPEAEACGCREYMGT